MGERGEAVRSYCEVSAIFDLELHTYFTALRTCKGDRDTKAVLTTEALVSNNDSSVSTRELYSVFYFLDLLVKLVFGLLYTKKKDKCTMSFSPRPLQKQPSYGFERGQFMTRP